MACIGIRTKYIVEDYILQLCATECILYVEHSLYRNSSADGSTHSCADRLNRTFSRIVVTYDLAPDFLLRGIAIEHQIFERICYRDHRIWLRNHPDWVRN